jgi:hypothetical protein
LRQQRRFFRNLLDDFKGWGGSKKLRLWPIRTLGRRQKKKLIETSRQKLFPRGTLWTGAGSLVETSPFENGLAQFRVAEFSGASSTRDQLSRGLRGTARLKSPRLDFHYTDEGDNKMSLGTILLIVLIILLLYRVPEIVTRGRFPD